MNSNALPEHAHHIDIYADDPLDKNSVAGLDVFLTLQDVLHHVGIGKTTVYKLMNAGYFPKNFQIQGTSTKVWSYADIKRWMEAQRMKEIKK